LPKAVNLEQQVVRNSPRVVVVGSLNLDYLATVDRLPTPGQTIAALDLFRRFGGKGANQAVAAARQGAKVSLIGCVGDDEDGRAYVKRLQAEHIEVKGIKRTPQALTGTALIAVERRGENTIIVAAGANGCVGIQTVKAQRTALAGAQVILLQFEIPMKATVAAVREANHAGVPVILNPSPLRPDFPWGRLKIETLIVNAGEAQSIFRLPVADLKVRLRAWRKALEALKVNHLIITRGARATIYLSGTQQFEIPTLRVKTVDTVGAGDAFTGTFAARLSEGMEVLTAIRLANCAGALTTLKPGAQEAIPNRLATNRAVRGLPWPLQAQL
jgi:ribokinase